MPKFRSREIVEATQWFPGMKINGITEVDGFGFFTYSFQPLFDRLETETALLVRPGDYIRVTKGRADAVWKKNDFEKQFEDVGG